MSDSNFNTPPDFLALVRRLAYNGAIGLDPCSNANSMTAAITEYCEEDNGLAHPWRGHGLVFMNPPHSQSPHNIEPWIDKLIEEFDGPLKNQDQFVALVPAKTGPQWFHKAAYRCDARCFLEGRIKFWQDGVPQKGSGKFDSLVLYRGKRSELFASIFCDLGWVA